MKRRHFVKNTVGGVLLPTLLNGFGVKAFGMSPFSSILNKLTNETDHVLIIIQLAGGNDGLHTLIPLDQYGSLSDARPNIILPQSSLLSLSGQSLNALHPAMSGIQALFNDGKATFIQSVGYPNQDYSHFRSSDIWMSGSDYNQVISSGWAGRYLNYEYPNFPQGYPNADMPHPLAVEIAYTPSATFMGPAAGMSVTISDPSSFYDIINGIHTPAPNTPAGEKLEHVRLIADQANAYGAAMTTAYNQVTNQSTYPANNELAEKLKIIAALIAGGLKTRIYHISLEGFDTHDSQVLNSNTTLGEHADLLKQLSDAIKAFMDDCAYLGLEDRVVGMTFSEFGRRIKSNFSDGTDHGAAAPMILFGKYVQSGILGTNPVIPANINDEDNLPMQYDFRSVYSSVLEQWFCVPGNDVDSVLLQNFQSLPLFNAPSCISSIHEVNQTSGKTLLTCSPNPFTDIVNFEFETNGSFTMIQIFNPEGKLLATPVSGVFKAGKQQLYWNSEDLPTGNYYARLQNGATQQVKMIVKVR